MGRIYIDTDELHSLARDLRADAGALGDINRDLVGNWARTHAPPVELVGLAARSAWVQGKIAITGGQLHAEGAGLDVEAWATDAEEGVGDIVGGLLGGAGWRLREGLMGWPRFGLVLRLGGRVLSLWQRGDCYGPLLPSLPLSKLVHWPRSWSLKLPPSHGQHTGVLNLQGFSIPFKATQDRTIGGQGSFEKPGIKREGLGVVAQTGASVFYGFRQAADVKAGNDTVNVRAGGNIMVGGEASGHGSAGISPQGVKAEIGGDAFVGGKAEGTLAGQVSGVSGQAKGSVRYGIGAGAHGSASLSAQKIAFSADLSLAFGFGASGGLSASVDPMKVSSDVEHALFGHHPSK